MTDKEFWLEVRRHLLGIIAAITRRWLSDA